MKALFFFLICLAVPAWAGEPRLNVLVLFADDQRADTIAALGNPVIQTPNLDKLVKRGMAFYNAHMQGGMQRATCVPSRAMLLSGRNLFHADEKLMREATWPEAFGWAGYATCVTGKWHNGDDSLVRSFQTGRSLFTGGMTDPMQAKLRNVEDGRLGAARPVDRHACEVFADEAIRFLGEPRERPFFLYVAFDAPHDPHIVPEEFPVKYDPAQLPLTPSFLTQHPFDNGEMTVRDEQLLPWPRTAGAVQSLLAEYYRYISYLDAQIGRVLDALDASAFAENTIVVFSADSGVARGSHGLIGKQNVYAYDAVRVPLVIAGPGIPPGTRTDALCYLFDVLPTLGARCGVQTPNASDGFDFNRTLHDPQYPARDGLLFAYRDVQRAYTDGRWKVIRYPQVNRTQLFNLEADPHEAWDLGSMPEHADRMQKLLGLLSAEMHRSGDAVDLRLTDPEAAGSQPEAALQKKEVER